MIAVVNREVERLFGYADGELIGQSLDVLVPDVAHTNDAAPGRDFTAPSDPRAIGAGRELFGRRRDGSEVPVEVGLTPIRLDGSALLLASVIDLTERRRVQLALDERLTFERFVGELGAEFVNLRPEERRSRPAGCAGARGPYARPGSQRALPGRRERGFRPHASVDSPEVRAVAAAYLGAPRIPLAPVPDSHRGPGQLRYGRRRS